MPRERPDIILEPGRTFQEFSLLPAYGKKDCVIKNVNLETRLHSKLSLGIHMLSAAMTSVTLKDMALALGKEKGMGVLPARLAYEEQADTVKQIKSYEMGFVEEPLKVRETATIEEVLLQVTQHGHSKVPVVDKNNIFLGFFVYQDYIDKMQSQVRRTDPVTRAMITIEGGVPYVTKPDLNVQEAKKLLEEKSASYLVVLDEQRRLVKLAFKKDEEKLKVAAAISTHPGWQSRVRANIDAGVDLIVIDTSDGHKEFTEDVIKEYKAMGIEVPICAGNIVTYAGAEDLIEAGADIVKIGMSSGSICITKRTKAVGRAPMTALMDAADARDDYEKKTGKHIPLIMDGGITGPADMIIALKLANACMMGGYFNRFYEAAGDKLDQNEKPTTDESAIQKVATWGEGSMKAQNLARYGHSAQHTFFPEGVEGTVEYAGRLKPNLKRDLTIIRAAMANAGCYDLEQYRKEAVIELNSPVANELITNPHNVEVKGGK